MYSAMDVIFTGLFIKDLPPSAAFSVSPINTGKAVGTLYSFMVVVVTFCKSTHFPGSHGWDQWNIFLILQAKGILHENIYCF